MCESESKIHKIIHKKINENKNHRIKSANANFQKAIYYLFLLKTEDPDQNELSSLLIREYQCIFFLATACCLLDLDFDFSKRITKEMRQELLESCKFDIQIDPSIIFNHSFFQSKWSEPFKNIPQMHKVACDIKEMQRSLKKIRDEILYRPFFKEECWNDCDFLNLFEQIPKPQKLEDICKTFLDCLYGAHEEKTQERRYIMDFINQFFWQYEDRNECRPTESLLLSYARMFKLQENKLDDLAEFRNRLINNNTKLDYSTLQKYIDPHGLGEERCREFLL